MRERASRRWSPTSRSRAWLYALSVVMLVALVLLFDVLGHAARVDEPTDLDLSIHAWVVRHRAAWPWLTGVFRWATMFGNPAVATPATAVITFGLYTLYRRGVRGLRKSEAFVWLGAILGGRLLSIWLKVVFQRERPPIMHRLVPESTYSFPSGHSVFAAVFFTMLAVLLARLIPRSRPRLRAAAVGACLPLAVLIAVSRVWLGVHYPTDVVGGLLLGAGWVFAVCLVRIGWSHWRGHHVLAARSLDDAAREEILRTSAGHRPPA